MLTDAGYHARMSDADSLAGIADAVTRGDEHGAIVAMNACASGWEGEELDALFDGVAEREMAILAHQFFEAGLEPTLARYERAIRAGSDAIPRQLVVRGDQSEGAQRARIDAAIRYGAFGLGADLLEASRFRETPLVLDAEQLSGWRNLEGVHDHPGLRYLLDEISKDAAQRKLRD